MSTTIATYVGNGSQTNFAFSFDYLRREFVKVLVDGVEVAFTFHTPQTVQITPAPATGKVIIIRRETDRDRLVTFVDGSVLLAGDLNVAQLQAIHIAAEALDAASGSLLIDQTGAYSAGFRRIADLGDPTNNRDAVTKQWAETAQTATLGQALSARTAAETASAAAAADRVSAETARTGAETARTQAQTARTDAQTAQTAAETARTQAQTARTGAETARTGAETARTGAEAARDSAAGTLTAVQAQVATFSTRNPEDRIINGNMGVWQRGNTFSGPQFTADRWQCAASGGTQTTTPQSFGQGDTLGSQRPALFLRHAVSGLTLATHFSAIVQSIEGVRSYHNQTITVLGWARRSAGAGDMAVNLTQFFGQGGSPSPQVNVPGQRVTLSSVWQPFAVTFNVPTIVGTTLGTSGTDCLQVAFWASAGENFNAQAASLGLQTITVDLFGVHIRVGTHTAAATDLYAMPDPALETERCKRFFQTLGQPAGNDLVYLWSAPAAATYYLPMPMPVEMRVNPTGSIRGSWTLSGISSLTVTGTRNALRFNAATSSTGIVSFQNTGANSQVWFNAEIWA